MRMEEVKIGNVTVVKPMERRLDAATAVSFKSRMADLINAGERLIVLDLTEVEFVDSTGLGAIVSSLKSLGPEGDLVIAGVGDMVMNLFRLTRMNRVFRIFPTAREAVGALAGGPS
ncbi:MAG TPA: STAS domain-containing protein [Syntrophales bacterium]|mgnify:CR=1 FL=1|nr:STAS domain-containing protein [Syntrophales bacterium]HOM06374.1 STAS domain-containing protein [Syntrophales bacterium]HON99175.1 STAS domain-containing protein [Syntrophales bacterium]HPC00283.1 STAS domain-containing protein [Syntrophales bacterium]HPQ05946.1 STAS domain-containing protein [Syntrophales bacterium]